MRTQSLIAVLVLAAAVPLSAQAPAAPRRVDAVELRHQIYVMEGALARAVAFGAQRLNQEIRSVMPDLLVLAGDATARGFYLDGHGVFFDVEVPVLRQSMMWSLRMMLEQDQQGARAALTELKRHIASLPPGERNGLEAALRQLEVRVTALGPNLPPGQSNPFTATAAAQGAPGAQPVSSGGAVLPAQAGPPASPAPPAPPSAVRSAILDDPNRAYTESVQRALVDAMIDFSAPMALSPDEWLTVAARDNERRDTLAPQNPYEEVVTVMLRIKGSDLAAYRSGAIDREEARRRVSVKTF